MKGTRHLFALALGGLVAAAIGFFAGGLIGAVTCDWSVREAGCLQPSVYGVIIGSSVLIPFGVQLTSRRRDSFPLFLLTLFSAGAIGSVGFLTTFATGLGGIIVAIPVVQIIACVAIHRPIPVLRPLTAR